MPGISFLADDSHEMPSIITNDSREMSRLYFSE